MQQRSQDDGREISKCVLSKFKHQIIVHINGDDENTEKILLEKTFSPKRNNPL